MIDVKALKALLSVHPDDAQVIDVQGEPIVHASLVGDRLILSASQPEGRCLRCRNFVYPTTTDPTRGYKAYCPHCDEDMFSFELRALDD